VFVSSCGIDTAKFACSDIADSQTEGDVIFAGKTRFKSFGVDGLGVVQIDDCKIAPPIRTLKLPEGSFEDSILALNGEAWNLSKPIEAEAKGSISCTKSSGCRIDFTKMSGMRIVEK
jgi:hypothetical protein